MIPALLRRWGRQAQPIRTARLRLVTMSPEMLAAEAQGRVALGELLQACVPEDWPAEHWEPHVWAHILAQYKAAPGTFGWHRYMLTDERNSRLVGCLGGFPCPNGDVEIGYSVANCEQRRGYGSEAAAALMDWLLERPEVRSVSAQAFETAPGSIKIMQRCGMRCVGVGDQPGTIRYRRWRGQALEPAGLAS